MNDDYLAALIEESEDAFRDYDAPLSPREAERRAAQIADRQCPTSPMLLAQLFGARRVHAPIFDGMWPDAGLHDRIRRAVMKCIEEQLLKEADDNRCPHCLHVTLVGGEKARCRCRSCGREQ